jgi:hypothetical protein
VLYLSLLLCHYAKEEIYSVANFWDKREKPVVEKLTIPEGAFLNSTFIIKKFEQAKRRLKEHPFPIELLKANRSSVQRKMSSNRR